MGMGLALGRAASRTANALIDGMGVGEFHPGVRAAAGAGALGGIGAGIGGLHNLIYPGEEEISINGETHRVPRSRLKAVLSGMGTGALAGGGLGTTAGLFHKKSNDENKNYSIGPYMLAGSIGSGLGMGLTGGALGGLYGALNPGHDVVDEDGKQKLVRRSRLQGALHYGLPLMGVGGAYGALRGVGHGAQAYVKSKTPKEKTAFELGVASVRR